MFRQACVTLLIATTTLTAEDQNLNPGNQTAPERSGAAMSTQVYRYYKHLRRGTMEDVAIVLLPEEASHSISTPISIASVRLDLESPEGLSISSLRYPKGHKKKFPLRNEPIPITTGGLASPIRFRVHAAAN